MHRNPGNDLCVLIRCSPTLKGTSILETVISMTILLTILSLTFTGINRVNQAVNPQAVYKAHLLTNAVLAREDLLIEETADFEIEGYRITKQLKPMGAASMHLVLEVYNGSGKLLLTRHKILADGINI